MSRFSPKNKSFWLSQLFESNYRKLHELVPGLEGLQKDAVADAHGKPVLHLTFVERSPYTLTFDLSHLFKQDVSHYSEPRIRIRVYLDGKCAEAIDCPESGAALEPTARPASAVEVLNAKWALNYFLARWLEHCLRNRYRFDRATPREEPVALA
jgi:uncharacterized protein